MDPSFQSYQFSFKDVHPSYDEIKVFLQSDKMEDDHPVNAFIRDVLPEMDNNPNIKGGYIIRKTEHISPKDGTIAIEDQELDVGKQICTYMKGADLIALFLCTAGPLFTKLTDRLNKKGEIMEAFVVDAIGSLTVEKAMDKIQEELELKLNNEGLKISNRYSPGYCNWHLSGQQLLFDLIGNNPTGISLTESCLMTPIKSVSGIIGIGSGIKKKKYGCRICQNKTCIYRKIINKN